MTKIFKMFIFEYKRAVKSKSYFKIYLKFYLQKKKKKIINYKKVPISNGMEKFLLHKRSAISGTFEAKKVVPTRSM